MGCLGWPFRGRRWRGLRKAEVLTLSAMRPPHNVQSSVHCHCEMAAVGGRCSTGRDRRTSRKMRADVGVLQDKISEDGEVGWAVLGSAKFLLWGTAGPCMSNRPRRSTHSARQRGFGNVRQALARPTVFAAAV
jgi:hypothetical protein